MFTLTLETRTAGAAGLGKLLHARLNLVDLAGAPALWNVNESTAHLPLHHWRNQAAACASDMVDLGAVDRKLLGLVVGRSPAAPLSTVIDLMGKGDRYKT